MKVRVARKVVRRLLPVRHYPSRSGDPLEGMTVYRMPHPMLPVRPARLARALGRVNIFGRTRRQETRRRRRVCAALTLSLRLSEAYTTGSPSDGAPW